MKLDICNGCSENYGCIYRDVGTVCNRVMSEEKEHCILKGAENGDVFITSTGKHATVTSNFLDKIFVVDISGKKALYLISGKRLFCRKNSDTIIFKYD